MTNHVIGYIAALFTTISFLPQAVKTIKSRNTEGISLLMYIFLVAGIGFWIIYGIAINNHTIIISNSITFVLAGLVLITKIRNRG